MAKIKEIQRRIKSIANTKKITRAMEMVAAAKMRKAVEAVLKTRTYANLSWTTVLNISQSTDCRINGEGLHPLLRTRSSAKKVAIVLFTSNRGLCGGVNAAIMNKAHDSTVKHLYNDQKEKIDTDFIVVGNKGRAIHTRYGHNVTAEFPKSDAISSVTEVRAVSRLVIDDFMAGKYDKIMVAYTDYMSAAKQLPRVKQLLPVDIGAEKDHYLGVVGVDSRVGLDREFVQSKEDKYLREKKNIFIFEYEPSPEEVLEEMLPRLIEMQLYQALLESNASEESARMSAMHQATEAANDMVNELTLFYNKARQSGITAEIAEISAGANALADD